jgi:hypothetical protein
VLRTLLAVALSATALALDAGPASAVVPPSGFFGVGGWAYPSAQQSSTLAGAGLKLVRGALVWGVVQPTANPSSRNWSDADSLATNAANDGFNVIFDLNGCAVWACGTILAPPTGAELTAYEGFVRAAVQRYRPTSSFWKGKSSVPTITWQVWNEVNAGYFWPNPTPAAYATFLEEISQTIKSVDPTANVIMSGLTAEPGTTGNGIALQPFLQGLYQQPGFEQSTSAIVVHGYAADPQGAIDILDEARRVMLANNDAAQPIWVSEMSWASGGPASPFTVTPALQATYLATSWSTMLACRARWNLQHVLWFSLQDEPASLFDTPDYWGFNNGLETVTGAAKPAYWDFLQFIGNQPLPGGEGDSCTLAPLTGTGGSTPSGDSGTGSGSGSGTGAATASVKIVKVQPYTNNTHTQLVSFVATQNGKPLHGVSFDCSLDSGRWQPCRSPFNAASARQGQHKLTVRVAQDAGAATALTSATASWVVATTPPDTVVTGSTEHSQGAGGVLSVSFTGLTPIGVGIFQCRLNHRRWHACASPYVRRLHSGHYTFAVRAIDRAGNVDHSPARISFSVR